TALLRTLVPVADGIPVRGFASSSPPLDLPAAALLINSTSAGLRETDAAPIDLTLVPRPAAVLDMIYNPAQTPLLRSAAALGIPCANGLNMLVHQGAKALEIWSGKAASVTAPTMAIAARAAMNAF